MVNGNKTNIMDIQIFEFFDGNKIRTIEIEDQVWFAGTDVCACLDIKNTSQAISSLDEDEVMGYVIHTPSRGNQSVNFISESGLYEMVFRSRKPDAKKFRKWVTKVVIPTIRKKGRYDHAKELILARVLLDAPSVWEKTFPDNFFVGIYRLYGLEFKRNRGTMGFVGGFINKYIYEPLLEGLPRELKKQRALSRSDYAKLHQFIEENVAKDVLKRQIAQIEIMLQIAQTKEHFEAMFFKAVNPNQMQLALA